MLLFLDVDGPLIPFGGEPGEYEDRERAGALRVRSPRLATFPLLRRLNPGDGARLLALPCELVWATAWMEAANEVVAPLLGLPALPVVNWADTPDVPVGLCWKTRELIGYAAGRPFVWLDDEVTEADREWVAEHHPAPALLHRVDPRTGLTNEDFATVSRWLRQGHG